MLSAAHADFATSCLAQSVQLCYSCAFLQVHQFDFCAAGGASGEANNEAVFKLAGIRPGLPCRLKPFSENRNLSLAWLKSLHDSPLPPFIPSGRKLLQREVAQSNLLLLAGHLLMAEWNNSVGRPCHYVAADLANHCIVVAIRCGCYSSAHLPEEIVPPLRDAKALPQSTLNSRLGD